MPAFDFPVSAIKDPLRVSGKFFRAGDEVVMIRAVTFGPFPVGAFPDEGRGQLARIRDRLGANALRLYEIPSLDFMHACAETGLRVFITIPWSQHIDFLSERSALAAADRLLLETVERFRGHPALAGYFVANEIETTLVRWMGAARVVEQLERLIDLGHANAPETLFAYANYPSTEYLLPQNQDFVAFNLYLEGEAELSAYLARLQNRAGDKPLFISEFGVDTLKHGDLGQAAILDRYLEAAGRSGVAGSTIFAWSDLWQRGGQTVEGWEFGLTRRDQTERPAVDVVRESWGQWSQPSDCLSLTETPKVSVIVCTYKGSATLVECLDSLLALNYPAVELILVNDGSDPRVEDLAKSYEAIRYLAVPHDGLGAARNTGASAATGEILIYTDDDCIVEPDWLKWIVELFAEDPKIGAVGGPNIPPRAETAAQARVAAAPGGPCHVLLSDTRAEHLPGCNLAVRKSVFEEVGGFNPIFRSAGDDVDFCWRILAAGYELGFHPAAFVWHHRRFSYAAYFRQQRGYGQAEALLMPVHRERFRGAGGAIWKGQVYASRGIRDGSFVYHGHYGHEPFQLVYPGRESGLSEALLHVLWWAIIAALGAGAIIFPLLFIPMGLMIAGSLAIALGRAGRSVIEPAFDSTTSRLTLAGLILIQGILRSGTRLLGGWRQVNWSGSVQFVGSEAVEKLASGWWKLGDEMAFWSSEGVGREALLSAILEHFPRAVDDVSGKTDIILKRGWFWNWAAVTVTEYHEAQGQLTRLRLLARPERFTRLMMLPLLIFTPVAVMLGFGFKSELITLVLLYLTISIGAKIFMWLRRPLFKKIAQSVGLKSL